MPIYLRDIGLRAGEIGTIFSLMAVSRIISGLSFSYLADRFQIRKKLIAIATFGTATCIMGLFFVKTFTAVLLTFFSIGLFVGPVIPMLDTTTIDVLSDRPGEFGRIRLYGTLSFGMATLIMGKIMQLFGSRSLLYVLSLTYWAMALCALKIPDSQLQRSKTFAWQTFRSSFLQGEVILFLVTSFLYNLAFTAYNIFYSLYLKHVGYGESFIGITWLLATLAEAAYFFTAPRLAKNIALHPLIVFTFFVTGFRWIVLGYNTTMVVVLAFQALHAISFGAFYLVLVQFVQEKFPSNTRTTAQSVFLLMNYGVAMILGSYLSGQAFAELGGKMLFVMAGAVTLFAGLLHLSVLFLLRSIPRRQNKK